MANWKSVLDVKEEWRKALNEEITIKELLEIIIPKMKQLPFPDDEELQSIIYDFEVLATEEFAEDKDFNYYWEELYDWANYDHNCWIGTF
jgi:hypothetical protein